MNTNLQADVLVQGLSLFKIQGASWRVGDKKRFREYLDNASCALKNRLTVWVALFMMTNQVFFRSFGLDVLVHRN